MKRFTLVVIALMLTLTTSAFAADKVLLSTNENGDVYTFDSLNPIIEIEGCPMLYTPTEVYRNLFFRGVPIEMYDTQHIEGRNMLVILLENGDQYAMDCLETYGDSDGYVLEESVYAFCRYYFGEDYDFLTAEPDEWR